MSFQGIGKDEPKEVTETGGKQSKLDYRFDLLDVPSLFALAKVLHEGAVEYGENNWRNISVESNLNHALMHIFAYLGGDKQDEHLEHAFTRLMFALGVNGQRKPVKLIEEIKNPWCFDKSEKSKFCVGKRGMDKTLYPTCKSCFFLEQNHTLIKVDEKHE